MNKIKNKVLNSTKSLAAKMELQKEIEELINLMMKEYDAYWLMPPKKGLR